MRSLASYEKELAKLRARHTSLFKQEKWVMMQTCGQKIARLLDNIARLWPDWKEKEPK